MSRHQPTVQLKGCGDHLFDDTVASAGPDVKVTTIEIDPKHKKVADDAIAHAGMSDRIEVLLGAGMDILPNIRAEVHSGTRPKFDFVFIDADKPNNLNYYNEAIALSRSRACVMVDNVVRRGMVADDQAADEDERVLGARKVRIPWRVSRFLSCVANVGPPGHRCRRDRRSAHGQQPCPDSR